MNLSMYNILEEHMHLLTSLEELDGEVLPEIEESLEINNDQFESKAVSYGYMIKHFEDQSDAIAVEIKRLTALKKSADIKSEYLRTRLADAMKIFSYEKIDRGNLKLSFRKSESVEIDDITIIPQDFLIQHDPTPDKAAIKSAIKAGDFVRGASLVINQNLQIK